MSSVESRVIYVISICARISVILKSTDEFECILWSKRCRHFDSRSLFDNCPSRRRLGLRAAASARHRGHRLLPQPELCSPPGGTRSWRGARSRRAEARLAGALVARFARSHAGLERSPVKLSSWRTIWFSCVCVPLPAQEMASIKANAVLRVRNGPGDGTLPVLSPHGMPM